MERLIKDKSNEFFKELELIHNKLHIVQIRAGIGIQEVEELCTIEAEYYKVTITS